MTREEAIELLQETKSCHLKAVCEALDMAIEALQTEIVQCKDCKHRYMDGEVTHYYWCRLHDRPVDDADYCSWGEKGGDDE